MEPHEFGEMLDWIEAIAQVGDETLRVFDLRNPAVRENIRTGG
ncbi:hypothetical protein [Aeromicrobium sp. 9AM]|nr:hypothetical protein [Aeromicrobium sp. 9AM]